ncbi:fluoride efflux transporter CrcB [Fodinisporobacter ferrooxydans]|uniref:Fluoride-specific ion channel FluC n=1 Tax=Fodinisporobacter ferrooxydans TaxID=2901836 RepID=A0ABY4CUD5_9BACL|nr:fluoride efflux transporter CrcB [Alicyclobacillaceae bacterium MYW30-H2]
MKDVLAIAIGGFVGAILRYVVGLWVPPVQLFPLGTLLINWIGCLFLGWFLTMTLNKWKVPPHLRLAIGTGVTGAFTTFSTFSVETLLLLKANHALLALSYVAASVAGGVLLAWIGFRLAKLA